MKRNTVFTSLFLILALLILSLLAVPAAATPDSWTTKTPMPKGGVCGAAVVNGKIYAVFMSLDNPIYEYN